MNEKVIGSRIPRLGHHTASGRARVRLRDAVTGTRFEIYTGKWGTPEAQERYEAIIGQWLASGRCWPATDAPPMSPCQVQSDIPAPDAPRERLKDAAESCVMVAHSGWLDDDPRRDITVAELAIRYIDHADSYYVKNGRPTRTRYLVRTALQVLLDDEELALTPAKAMGPRMVMKAAATLAKRTRPDGSPRYTRSTINDMIGQIKLMAKFAMQWELIDADTFTRVQCAPRLKKGRSPAPGVPAPREGKRVRPVDVSIVERTCEALPPMIAAMARLQLATAMRPIEVCAMKPEQVVETDRRGVWVYNVGDEGWKLAHQEGAERVVFMGPSAMSVLRPAPEISPSSVAARTARA